LNTFNNSNSFDIMYNNQLYKSTYMNIIDTNSVNVSTKNILDKKLINKTVKSNKLKKYNKDGVIVYNCFVNQISSMFDTIQETCTSEIDTIPETCISEVDIMIDEKIYKQKTLLGDLSIEMNNNNNSFGNYIILYKCLVATSMDMKTWSIDTIEPFISYDTQKHNYYDNSVYWINNYILTQQIKNKTELFNKIITEIKNITEKNEIINIIEHNIFGQINTDCRNGLMTNIFQYDITSQLNYLYNYLSSYIHIPILKPTKNKYVVIDNILFPKLCRNKFINNYNNKKLLISLTQKSYLVMLEHVPCNIHNKYDILFENVKKATVINNLQFNSLKIPLLNYNIKYTILYGLITSYVRNNLCIFAIFNDNIYVIPNDNIVNYEGVSYTIISEPHYIYKHNNKWNFINNSPSLSKEQVIIYSSLDFKKYQLIDNHLLYYQKNHLNIVQITYPDIFEQWLDECKMKYINTTNYIEPVCDEEFIPQLHYQPNVNIEFIPECKNIVFTHRSGWKYVMTLASYLFNKHNEKLKTVKCINFIEKTFSWDYIDTNIEYENNKLIIPRGNIRFIDGKYICKIDNLYLTQIEYNVWIKCDQNISHLFEGKSNVTPIPLQDEWIGIWHNPHNMPKWFNHNHSPTSILQKKEFKESLKYCKGIFVLSHYFADWLSKQIDVPISVLHHPTQTPIIKFDFDKFINNKNKCLIQIGYWLRRMCSIGCIKTNLYKKIWLYGNDWGLSCKQYEDEYHKNNNEVCSNMSDIVKLRLPNVMYDLFLSQNIAFVHLYDSSANNAVIECITRNTPIVINRHPAVLEYLGKDYPLYFDKLEEVEEIISNFSLIQKAYEYLKNNEYIHKLVSGNHFIEQFANSEVINNL
jgi:hypothetical protein